MCSAVEKLLVWLFFAICFNRGFGEVFFFHPPQLDIEEAYIDRESNSTLEINCVGKYPVYWNVPETRVVSANDSRLSIVSSSDVLGSAKRYRSQLILQGLHYRDTGSYNCYYDGTKDFTLRDNVTSIYVFVNDPDNLFVEKYDVIQGHMFVLLHQQQKGIIGCLPTNSRTNVTLWKTEGEDELVPLGQDITFNPTEGFHIFYPTLYFSGIFQCRATVDGKQQTINLTIHCMPTTYHDPQPFIDMIEASYPIINETFTLRCYVSVDIITRVFFFWDYPQKNSSDGRINIPVASTRTMESTGGFMYNDISSYLIVNDAQPEDSGIYTCTVVDHNERTGTAEKMILVHSPQQPSHVNFTTDIDISKPLIHKAGKDVRFVITVTAFPSMNETKLYWTKNGELLVSNSHYHIKKTAISVILEIKQLSRFDTAVYTLFGETRDMTNHISITLNVADKPIITLKNTSELYMLGQRYMLNCRAEGYPRPVVWWRWKPCKVVKDCVEEALESSWREVEDNVTLPNDERITWEVLDSNNFTTMSHLVVTANHTGHYQCFAGNSMGTVNLILPFIVTDAKGGFEVSVSDRRPIDRDNVTLECKVNIFNFSYIEWRWRAMLLGDELKQLENSSDVTIYTESSVYSHSSFVEFRPIHLSFSGEYECIAFHEGTNATSHQYITIDVQGIQKPVINRTNMIGATNFESLESLKEFYCYVSGVPSPEIKWMKDGKTIDVSMATGAELTERQQRLTIKHVTEKDAGRYECIVENRGGMVKASTTLKILDNAETPDQNRVTSIILIIVFVVIGIVLFVVTFFLVQHVLKDRKQKKELDFLSQNVFERGYVDILNPNLPLVDQIDLLPYKHRYEFPKERLKLGKTLGQGAFGRVVKAEAIGLVDGEAATTVAVKMLKETADKEQRKALVAELKILIHLGRQLNIVNLLGAVTKNLSKGELLVIVEYCCHGNLRHYLLKHKESYVNQLDPVTGKFEAGKSFRHSSSPIYTNTNVVTYANILGIAVENPSYAEHSLRYAELDHQLNDSGTGTSVITGPTGSSTCDNYFRDTHSSAPTASGSECCCDEDKCENHFVTTCDLVCYAFQCSRGMDYLISRKLIHRDLAARNVLLATNNVVKICDFGLAKDCYKYSNYIKKSDGLLPIKWMAIESIRDRVFTPKTDVWSFGVLLWEIFTFGGNPYPGVEINEEFFKKLKNGYRMEKPDLAPDSIYQLMKSCWLDDPSQRPDFSVLSEKIGSLLEAGVREYYIELNEPYQRMNEELINNNDYLQMNGSSVDYADMQKLQNDLDVGDDLLSSPQNTYDNVTSVRPVGNGPVSKIPMEIVPMIQLDSISHPWSEDSNQQEKSLKEFVSDLNMTASPPVTENDLSDYLSMDCSDRTESCGSEEDNCVFLKNLQTADLPHYMNGDYTSVPLLLGSPYV